MINSAFLLITKIFYYIQVEQSKRIQEAIQASLDSYNRIQKVDFSNFQSKQRRIK